ncbi:MAG TPA: TerC family protein [Prolixibacteraceae bacterium]|nr:TerC family protein [Prolixibacteraceae bacterium]
MEIFFTAEAWIALLTLTFLEIVLGVDNVIFISIVTNKLPASQQQYARRLGLSIALIFRIFLLTIISWMTKSMTEPLFSVFNVGFSIRELILLTGGLFLLAKSTSEIHAKMENLHEGGPSGGGAVLSKVIIQIIMLDIVFSFDSILTAVGLTNHLSIMILAVVISLFIMIFFADKISKFIATHPTLEILALSFLILIGFMLVLEGVHVEVPKGYIYFAVFFSLLVEIVNMRIQKKHHPVVLRPGMEAGLIGQPDKKNHSKS